MRLSMRKVTVLFSAALFGTICIFLYLCLESQRLTGSHSLYSDPGDFSSMELKLEELEHELMNNHHTINEIKKALYEIVREDNSSVQRLRTLVDPSFSDVEDVISMDTVKQRVLSLTGEECSFAEMPAQKSDVQVRMIIRCGG
ncbi:PREDICTED: uncharacterized protein LOC106819633 [Priapulus caudatus]|uniref:Uncharacterized protein LOC106819633 n=1 Tax=Priapulus caudatus TaxID=37621 RepID=A0ABM1F5K6_PRICU|nr:PREDICTED: uncharacterized protein LOC106819633 [Priapulus caudatus]